MGAAQAVLGWGASLRLALFAQVLKTVSDFWPDETEFMDYLHVFDTLCLKIDNEYCAVRVSNEMQNVDPSVWCCNVGVGLF